MTTWWRRRPPPRISALVGGSTWSHGGDIGCRPSETLLISRETHLRYGCILGLLRPVEPTVFGRACQIWRISNAYSA